MNPREISEFLQEDVIGQSEALRFVSVAIFKHLRGERFGNLMLIGNSGTGKTTIMRSMERLYGEHEDFHKYRVVIIMNANTFATDQGVIDTRALFANLEERARRIIGPEGTPQEIARHMEHATVCLDEIDKVSGVVGGKPYVTGINIQQALLTMIEGERVVWPIRAADGSEYRADINTGKMLFLCAGAFETLYDQVFKRVTSPTSRVKLPTETVVFDGEVRIREYFTLSHHFKLEDLFDYGMQPQFLSRFDNSIILEDLDAEKLALIFTGPEDSVFKLSKKFFQKVGIELEITEGASRRVALAAAEERRIGARALKEVWGRIVKPFEYAPEDRPEVKQDGDVRRLVIDEAVVMDALKSPIATLI
jgi:ATP-dependent Clp protease ATP-binding subunit ClpX